MCQATEPECNPTGLIFIFPSIKEISCARARLSGIYTREPPTGNEGVHICMYATLTFRSVQGTLMRGSI